MKHPTTNIQHRTSHEIGVEQASGLWFRASRPKPESGGHLPHDGTSASNQSSPMKFGATPNFTGVTPVPPAALSFGRSMLDVFQFVN
jgi:hypothetical protein